MKRLSNVLKQPAFHLLMLCFGFVLLNWPFLEEFHYIGARSLFIYLFTLWALGIIVLFFIGTSYSRERREEDQERDE